MNNEPDQIADPAVEDSPTTESEDRRIAARIPLSSRNVILVETFAGEEGPVNLYIYISNVSETGMRITSDLLLPIDLNLRMKFMLDRPIEAEARLNWFKEIGAKNFLMGLEFLKDSEINKSGVPALLKWAEPRYGKKSIRINSKIFIETDFTNISNRFYTYMVVISEKGMEIRNNFPFPEEGEFALKFSLGRKSQGISTRGRVLFQREIRPGQDDFKLASYHKIWVEFLEPERVRDHINETLEPA